MPGRIKAPGATTALAPISGVGEAKLGKYGYVFIAVLRQAMADARF